MHIEIIKDLGTLFVKLFISNFQVIFDHFCCGIFIKKKRSLWFNPTNNTFKQQQQHQKQSFFYI